MIHFTHTMFTIPDNFKEAIADMGLDVLPEEERNELLAEIGEVLFHAVMRRVWEVLTPELQEELFRLFEGGDDDPDSTGRREQVDRFLEERVPDFARFVKEECESLLAAQRSAYEETGS